MSEEATGAATREDQPPGGARKAATILLAMGKPLATRLLRHFDPDELREVVRSAARLGSVPMARLESLVEEFSSDFSAGANLLGDPDLAKDMLSDAVSPQVASQILADAFGAAEVNVWEALGGVPEAVFSAYLKNEHPLTTTHILSKLPSSLAGKLIALLPQDMRNEVFCRMISPAEISDTASLIVEGALRDDLLNASKRAAPTDGRARMAEIINSLDPADADAVMQKLAQANPKDALALKALLFSFNDLPRLSLRARALLFDKVSTDIVVLSLRGTDSEFRDVVLASMASRARRLVEAELNTASNAPAKDIARARKQIADLVLRMAQRGAIEIAPPDDSQDS